MIRIKVRGLDGLEHDFEVAEDRLKDGIHTLTSELADDSVKVAKRRASRDMKTGKHRDSIRSMGPTVSGGAGLESYGFYDFGGKVGPNRSIHREYVKGGRFLFPATKEIGVMAKAEKLADDVGDVIE